MSRDLRRIDRDIKHARNLLNYYREALKLEMSFEQEHVDFKAIYILKKYIYDVRKDLIHLMDEKIDYRKEHGV